MGKEILTFGDFEIEKHKFYWYKSLIFCKGADIENLSVSNKISPGEEILNTCKYWLLVWWL